MAKKTAISGEYIISEEDNGALRVCKIYDNVMASLREIAATRNFEIDPKWNTQDTGRHICKEFGDGKRAEVGEYVVTRQASGKIETYRTYANTTAALREIAAGIGFEINEANNTRQMGSKLIDFINGNK